MSQEVITRQFSQGTEAALAYRGEGTVSHQIANAPELSELGITIKSPEDRKDSGAIEYTTLDQTVLNWAEDPYGVRTKNLLAETYGIPHEKMDDVLDEAGLEEYRKYKEEGRFIGMVASQVLNPTYYFMSNALILGELNKRGIPTAFMVMGYPQDKFLSGNFDKRNAFGKLEFPIGIEEQTDDEGRTAHKLKTTRIELKPYGIRHESGEIERINNMNRADGYRCDQVLVQVTGARGVKNESYVKAENTEDGAEFNKTFYQAALGMDVPGLPATQKIQGKKESLDEYHEGDPVSITDFYRILWDSTIERMRESGDLPSEEEMPIFYVDGFKLYTTLAKEAKPPVSVLEKAGFHPRERVLRDILKLPEQQVEDIMLSENGHFDEALQSRNLKLLDNGLLAHPNGMLDPGAYYIAQTALPDLYLECSSCGGDEFVGKLQRAQEIRKEFGFPEREVRIPDEEIADLERYSIHPSGRVYIPDGDYLQEELRTLGHQINEIPRKPEFKELRADINNRIKALRERAAREHIERVEQFRDEHYANVDVVLPPTVASWYKELLRDVDTVMQSALQEPGSSE